MDLVDIDKVLDSLELNEEEHVNVNSLIKPLEILSSDILRKSDLIPPDDSATIDEPTSIKTCITETNSQISERFINRFVGVSQVFSSLDDYRKNIETLQVGIEQCKNNKSYEGSNDIPYAKVDKECDACADTKVDDLCEDDEINKFVNIDEEVGISSNSITTSSSSFSSGPSSALLSSESELSLDAAVSDQSVLLSQKYNHTREVDNNLQPVKSKNKINCDNELNRSEFDDLAVGLSSISLTNEASLLHSEISSKYNLKTEFLSSKNDREENKHNSKVDNSEPDGLDKNYTIPQLVSNQNVMVTFGSTMDEISDTELDSILQEIDPEMPSQSYFESVSSDEANDFIKKDVNIESKDNFLNMDNTSMVEHFPTYDSTCDDVINVDSFSQASTIEFAEDRTQDGDINSCRDVEELCDGDSEELKNENQNGQKRQRPTTLDLPMRKINLYASAGQTPPGSRIYDHNTSSSDEDSPGDKANKERDFNDAAGHTPPERSDRSIANVTEMQTEIANLILNRDEPMTVSDNIEGENQINQESQGIEVNPNLGKVPPIWVPDNEANSCMQCQHKFTLLKRRHHCRACGQVLCSVCCSQKFKLEFLSNPESRVCVQCFLILSKFQQHMEQHTNSIPSHSPSVLRTPNPNNPMEYCSTIPPYRQVNPQAFSNPTVIVPVGVLKKEGNHKKSRKRKSVMFSDGIRPGSDLANLDGKWSDAKHARKSISSAGFTTNAGSGKVNNRNAPNSVALPHEHNHFIFKGENTLSPINVSNKQDREANLDGNWSDAKHSCISIPSAGCAPNVANITGRNASSSVVLPEESNSFMFKDEYALPPIFALDKSDKVYQEVPNNANLIKRLHSETLKFVVQTNFYVFVKISHLKCCINKTVINFTTCGLHHVGNDEIMILLELDNSNEIPKDIFIHLNDIYLEASKGRPIAELGFSMPRNLLFLGSREHGGFLFIRSTFQCLQDVQVPDSPFLIGVLIHRWEVPWAKIFPLRLMLRLGAQYRYYPSPHISVRKRAPVYIDIAQTIINLLADFRNYSYTIPTIKGMYIHMEDRRTNILIPRNRHEDVIKAIKNSSDHILAMGANFSKKADGHLVCIQNIKTDSMDSHSYSTQAINIQGQPRKVTGASFFILNEALKASSGLSGKCSIIEDGLMVQILPSKMIEIRNALNNMNDVNIVCGPIEASEQHTEVVYIEWVDDDIEINIGVKSPIDSKALDGIPSIRFHSGVKLSNGNHNLKWTEVFIIKISGNREFPQCKTEVNITNLSENIAKSASIALLPFLDLLAANGNIKIGLRVTINRDKVCYEAGSQSEKLPPLYMNALDNELIPTLHTQANEIDTIIVLELILYILDL